MKKFNTIIPLVLLLSSCNPFAPGLDNSLSDGNSILGDPTTIDGIFRNMKYAYTFRDTTIYGQLLNTDFSFIYTDYDQGVEVTWGRDEEMQTTRGLFQNVAASRPRVEQYYSLFRPIRSARRQVSAAISILQCHSTRAISFGSMAMRRSRWRGLTPRNHGRSSAGGINQISNGCNQW